METSLSGQLTELAAALAFGLAFGVLYDVLRVIRRRVPLRITTLLCDFVFCVAAGVGLFVLGLTLGGGKARSLLGVIAVLGFALYFVALTRGVLYILEGFADVCGVFVLLCAFPARFFIKSIKKLVVYAKKLFIYWRKWYIFKERRLLSVKRPR